MRALAAFESLRNRTFAQLYAAQTISLFGDALTWVGLALLAFDLAGRDGSAAILGTALTLRVTAFVVLSPLAGALADRLDRKVIMVTADVARVVVVALIPFVTAIWQVYALILALNAFTAFFTPTYQATVPLVAGGEDYPKAIALSGATYEILGVLGPGVAGGLAALVGFRSVFWVDAGTFALSALLVATLPVSLRASPRDVSASGASVPSEGAARWRDVTEGTARLWRDRPLRTALLLELVTSIAGALILVNTVGRVRGGLALGEVEYGWVMAAFGIGATAAALAVGALEDRVSRTTFVFVGALVTSLAVLPADAVGLSPLLALWLAAGAGQNWVNLPTQTLIADRTPDVLQGRVYGAHFAWSHLWWAGAYPLAGWLGSAVPDRSFLYGGLVALGLLGAVALAHRVGNPRRSPATSPPPAPSRPDRPPRPPSE